MGCPLCFRGAENQGVVLPSSPAAGVCGGHMGWCLLREGSGRSVGGDLRDLRLSRLVGGLDEHGLGQLLAGRHRHLLDLIELLQHTESPRISQVI